MTNRPFARTQSTTRATAASGRVGYAVGLLVLAVTSGLAVAGSLDVTTQRYSNQHTSANLSESVLNTGNVNQTQFGKLWSWNVDDHVYAQPLYVESAFVNSAVR